MPRFRKPKPPVPVDTSTPTSAVPTELVRNLTSQRDPRALAVSSAAIALSIGSTFHDTRDAPSDGAAVRESDASWETVCSAVRMAVEIIKESSDLCPPLKAVVGAMSVLIKNCDVSLS